MLSSSERKPTLWQVIMSVLAAIFGIQSEKARHRDFTQGNPMTFIIVGILIVIMFVLLLYGLVSWIIGHR